MFGSASRCRNPWSGFMADPSSGAPAVCERPRLPCDRRPSGRRPAPGGPRASPALMSMAPAASASSTVYERASLTVPTAQSTGRPRSSAMAVMDAMASFMTLSPSVPSMSSPWPPTGVAAPMFVPGAIAATWPASVMNVPALAARPPAGATHTMTGRGASSSAWTMSRVASSEPPGRVQLDDHGRRAVRGGRGDAVLRGSRP